MPEVFVQTERRRSKYQDSKVQTEKTILISHLLAICMIPPKLACYQERRISLPQYREGITAFCRPLNNQSACAILRTDLKNKLSHMMWDNRGILLRRRIFTSRQAVYIIFFSYFYFIPHLYSLVKTGEQPATTISFLRRGSRFRFR